jgi:hypothetical protein
MDRSTNRSRHPLQHGEVEVLVMGEGPEWETIEYGADAAAEGKHKPSSFSATFLPNKRGMVDCAVV